MGRYIFYAWVLLFLILFSGCSNSKDDKGQAFEDGVWGKSKWDESKWVNTVASEP